MKKLFAVVMTLCLLVSAAALAEQAAVKEITWASMEETAAKIEGKFAEIGGTGVKMYIPSTFIDSEITEERKNEGDFLLLKTKEENAVVSGQVVKADIDAFKATLPENGATGVEDVVINGLHATMFNVVKSGILATCIAIGTDQGSVMLLSFAPADQEPFTETYRVMVASLQHNQ